MTADQARELAARANDPNTGAVGELVKYAHGRIERAAREGCRAITNPLAGLRGTHTFQQQELAYKHLESQGYKVKHDSDQREGKSWVTVSW